MAENKIINVTEVKPSFTKTTNKPYLRLKTGEGYMNIWDDAVKANVSGTGLYELDIETKGDFKNVVAAKKISGGEAQAPLPEIQDASKFVEKENTGDSGKIAGVCISYAKDLVCAGKIEIANIRTQAYQFLALYQEMADNIKSGTKIHEKDI